MLKAAVVIIILIANLMVFALCKAAAKGDIQGNREGQEDEEVI